MIINIPLQIDDAAIEGKLTKDFERLVTEEIYKKIEGTLKKYDDTSYYSNSKKADEGMDYLIRYIIENKIKHDWKDEIVKEAAKELARKTSRTKAAKELKDK